MQPTRRQLLKLLSLGVVGLELDIDRLLWTPEERTIFIPSSYTPMANLSQIVAIEMETLLPKLKYLFERDDLFYQQLEKHDVSGKI